LIVALWFQCSVPLTFRVVYLPRTIFPCACSLTSETSMTRFLSTSPVIRYPCMITCCVVWRYGNLAIESSQVILTVRLMTGCLPNRHEVHNSHTLCSVVAFNLDESRRCELGDNTNRTLRCLSSSWAVYFFNNKNTATFKRVNSSGNTMRQTIAA